MNLIDLVVLGIVGISALLGLSRGLVREVLGIGAWVLAGILAWRGAPLVMPLAHSTISNPDLADILAYAGTFLALLIILSLASNLVGRLVQLSALGGLDRTLGVVFGILRGSAVVVALYVVGTMVQPDPQAWPDMAKQARSLPLVYEGAKFAVSLLPENARPKQLPAPPGGRPTNSQDLLHATPEGRALGPKPDHI